MTKPSQTSGFHPLTVNTVQVVLITAKCCLAGILLSSIASAQRFFLCLESEQKNSPCESLPKRNFCTKSAIHRKGDGVPVIFISKRGGWDAFILMKEDTDTQNRNAGLRASGSYHAWLKSRSPHEVSTWSVCVE